MKHWGKYVPILALLAVGLFTAAPAAGQTGSVTGTILDASSGQPLDAVQVSLEAVGSGEVRYGGLTQASGRFLIINVPVAQYVQRAELLGFGTQTQLVDVTGGQAVVVDLRHGGPGVTMIVAVCIRASDEPGSRLRFHHPGKMDMAQVALPTYP